MLLRDFKESIYLASHSNMVRGLGAPSGTPSRAGLRYLDTTTGLMYLSRNVLNFNGSARIATPTITGVRRVDVKFRTNIASPPTIRQLWDGPEGFQTRARREATTGNINAVSAFGALTLDGVTITNNAVNPAAGVWHSYSQTQTSDRQFGFISQTNAGGLQWDDKIADVRVFGVSGVLLAQYAIDEGTGNGSTIYDSSGNGNHGTLTLGSGSWGLEWMLADTSIIQGVGAPTGVPVSSGLVYLDTSANRVYRSRNVLNFNGSSIATPVITGVHRVNLQFWHNDPNPNTGRVLHDGLNGDGGALLIYASRAVTTGFISNATVGTTFVLDGASIASDTVNPSASTWHTLTTNSTTGRKLTRIGSNRTDALNYLGRIANVQILGASDVLLAQYAIDEGSGTTIFDGSGNGLHSTLDIGTGSWVLGWVPL